tara:strand:- start:542 stop:1318 length:777 start_codon:yes stop_codon:yes gene_type:complete
MLGALVLLSVAKITIAQDQQVAVEPVQLTIRHKPTLEGVKMFGDPGLELQVAVKLTGKPILSVDPAKSRIIKFVDDAGTDLKAGAPTGFFSWIQMSNAFREEPVDSALLDIKTKTLPAGKAQRIEFDAVVALITASGTQEKQEQVVLKKGTKITCGPIPMTLGSVDKSSFGGSALNVQFSSSQSMDAVKEILFLDNAGKPIEAKSMGSGSFGFGGKKTYTKTFGLPKQLANVTIKIIAHANVETIEVPIKLSMGLGLR